VQRAAVATVSGCASTVGWLTASSCPTAADRRGGRRAARPTPVRLGWRARRPGCEARSGAGGSGVLRGMATPRDGQPATLGDEGFSRAWAEDSVLPLDEAVLEADHVFAEESAPSARWCAAAGDPAAALGLTPRERRCSGCWRATGRTSRSRDALFISRRTVHKHVENILGSSAPTPAPARRSGRAARPGLIASSVLRNTAMGRSGEAEVYVRTDARARSPSCRPRLRLRADAAMRPPSPGWGMVSGTVAGQRATSPGPMRGAHDDDDRTEGRGG
jgi:hypothetical protein